MVFVALLGLAVSAPPWVLLIAAFCAGFCISGGQKSVIALAAIFSPSANPFHWRGLGLGYRQVRQHRRPAPDRRAAGLPTQRGKSVLWAAVLMLLAGILVMLLGIKYKTPRASSCGRAVF